MAEELVHFELVSPEKLVISRKLEMVVVPGSEGDFGVLPRHAPFISTLRMGVVNMYEAGKVSDSYFVAGGFAEVTEERCTVLAERAVPVTEIDQATVEKELTEAKADLENADTDQEKAKAQDRVATAEMMLALSNSKAGHA